MDSTALARNALEGRTPGREEAVQLLRCPDEQLLDLLQAAFIVRRQHHGLKVRIHVLVNAKSGACPEDCAFCSQSTAATTPINKHPMLSKKELVDGARRAAEARAYKYCMVTATRASSRRELDIVCEAAREIKDAIPITLCGSFGLLTDEKARVLKEAGIDRYNHNLETSERFFPQICTTHTYQDRVRTLHHAKKAGLDTCSGGIVGMGEEDEDIVDLALALRALDVDSIPVNFLNPIEGTRLEDRHLLTPARCLKVLALFRLINPAKDIRVAGGREVNLRQLQPLALYAVNSLFAEGYLTTPGDSACKVQEMIQDLGFEVEQAPSAVGGIREAQRA